jgi:hypothetical protein
MARVWIVGLALLGLSAAAPVRAEIFFAKKFMATEREQTAFAVDLSVKMFPDLQALVDDSRIRITLTSSDDLHGAIVEYAARHHLQVDTSDEDDATKSADKKLEAVTLFNSRSPGAVRIVLASDLYREHSLALLQCTLAHEFKHAYIRYEEYVLRRRAKRNLQDTRQRLTEEIAVHTAIQNGTTDFIATDDFRTFLEDRLPRSEWRLYLNLLRIYLHGQEDVIEWYKDRLRNLRAGSAAPPGGRFLSDIIRIWMNGNKN